jgi:F-type H+-transporting ATPase subunit gamma
MGQGKSRQIRSKIQSIRNTQKVTRAMKMVSASKLRRATKEIEIFHSYMLGTEETLLQVIDSSCRHPFLKVNKSKKAVVVVYAGERSLCGSYNSNALKQAVLTENFLREQGYEVDFVAVGRKAVQGLKFRHRNIIKHFELPGTVPTMDFSRGIATYLSSLFTSGEYGCVYLCYTEFKSAMTKYNREFQLLPLDMENSVKKDFLRQKGEYQEMTGRSVYYYFEPSQDKIVEELLKTYLDGKIHGSYIESLASEYGSRMLAMENATKNAGELISALTLKLNRARQAAITQEIAEITGGAAGLEG